MSRFNAALRRGGVLLLLLLALSLAPRLVLAQGCPFGRDVTVNGQIEKVSRETRDIYTLAIPWRNCEIWIVRFNGSLPANCLEGRRFTAFGRIGQFLILPDDTYGLLATRLSCQ